MNRLLLGAILAAMAGHAVSLQARLDKAERAIQELQRAQPVPPVRYDDEELQFLHASERR